MNNFLGFLFAVLATLIVAGIVAGGLWRSLFELLEDICGTASRARFWRNYTAMIVVLVPVASVMMLGRVDERSAADVLTFADQFRWGLFGLIMALLAIAVIIMTSLPPQRPRVIPLGNATSEDIERIVQRIDVADIQPDYLKRLIHMLDDLRARQEKQQADK